MRRKAKQAARRKLQREQAELLVQRQQPNNPQAFEDSDESGRTVEAAYLIWKHFPMFVNLRDILGKPWYEFLGLYDEARYRENIENWKLNLSLHVPRLF